jgi:alpha,alpha-trehalase
VFLTFCIDAAQILAQLGYPFTRELIHKNITYYLKHTSHGSTLSYVVFAHILHKFDSKKAWKFYRTFVMSDIGDTQGSPRSVSFRPAPEPNEANVRVSCVVW